MILTINGTPSSGKGTVAKLLAQTYQLEHVSIGDIKRAQAQKRNLTIQEFNDWANANPKEGHMLFDKAQKELGETQDQLIVDGRVSFYFIPNSIKIHITCALAVAAQRRFNQLQHSQRSEGTFTSQQEVQAALEHRQESDRQLFIREYGVDIFDTSQYDIRVDSSQKTPQQVCDEIVAQITALQKESS